MTWSKGLAEWQEGGTTYLSIAFTWKLDEAYSRARFARACGQRVIAGGPALFLVKMQHELADVAEIARDYPDAITKHNPLATFASRGCPVGCWFCIVPKLEGKTFTLDWSFRPAPVLCDNNLSALPDDFQDHILARYAESGVSLLDCNSGFEPRTFTDATYRRWKGKFKGAWRFAFDEQRERPEVETMMRLLGDEKPRKKQVYVLVGNEPVEACHERAQQVIAWGGEPHCQFVLPLNWLGDPKAIRPRHDWTYQLGKDFCRYYNTRGWRSYPISEYKPRVNEPEPFKRLAA